MIKIKKKLKKMSQFVALNLFYYKGQNKEGHFMLKVIMEQNAMLEQRYSKLNWKKDMPVFSNTQKAICNICGFLEPKPMDIKIWGEMQSKKKLKLVLQIEAEKDVLEPIKNYIYNLGWIIEDQELNILSVEEVI